MYWGNTFIKPLLDRNKILLFNYDYINLPENIFSVKTFKQTDQFIISLNRLATSNDNFCLFPFILKASFFSYIHKTILYNFFSKTFSELESEWSQKLVNLTIFLKMTIKSSHTLPRHQINLFSQKILIIN